MQTETRLTTTTENPTDNRCKKSFIKKKQQQIIQIEINARNERNRLR